MSTLKTNNIEHLDASTPSIQTTIGGGTILAGVSTVSDTLKVGSNITLNTDGSATVAGGNINFESNGDGQFLGRLKIGGTDADPKIFLNESAGSATFTSTVSIAGSVTSTYLPYGFTSNATSFPFTAESNLGSGGKAFFAKHTGSGSAGSYFIYGENSTGQAFSVATNGSAQFTTSGTVATFIGNGIEVNNSIGSNVFIGTQDGTDGKMGTRNNSNISLFTNNDFSKRVELQTDGDLSIIDGNLVVASGHGIDFSATGDSTGAISELLDDYEEGTWTPTYGSTTGSFGSITYNIQDGDYTKIGNMVYIECRLRTTAVTVGTAGGGLLVAGLPFTLNSAQGTGGCPAYSNYDFSSSSAIQYATEGRENTSQFYAAIGSRDDNVFFNEGPGALPAAATAEIRVQFFYRTNS